MNTPLYINRILTNPMLGKCDIIFRKGLNVIYTNKLGKFTNTSNSVGKTTLINLIDFGLGKTNFLDADKKKNKEAIEFFDNVSIILEIKIFEKQYTVVRHILEDNLIQVYNEWNIDSVKRGELKVINYELEPYRAFLEKEIYGEKIFVDGKKIISIRSLLKYLFRNQKTGFIKYNAYMPNENGKTCSARLDFLVGKIHLELKRLENEIKSCDEKIKDEDKKKKILTNYFAEIDNRKKIELKAERTQKQKAIDLIETDIIKLEKEIIEKEGTNKLLFVQKNEYEKEYKKYLDEIYFIEQKITNYQKAINEIKNEIMNVDYISASMEILNPFKQTKCPVYLKQLKEDKNFSSCPLIEDKEEVKKSGAIIFARKKLLDFEEKDIEKAVQNLIENKDEKLKFISFLSEKIINLENEINNNNEIVLEQLNKLKDEKNDFVSEIREIDVHIKNIEKIDTMNTLLKNYRKNKKDKYKEYDDLNAEITKDIYEKLEETYCRVVKFITDDTRDGIIIENNLEPQILFKNSNQKDNGAAISVIKVIAYDIALLEFSMKYKSKNIFNNHPLILVHDSPKIHDMDLEMYKRIFEYVIHLQESEDFKEIPFQYIITTLDLSKEVTENPTKYIALELDNSGEGGKLFGRTINV